MTSTQESSIRLVATWLARYALLDHPGRRQEVSGDGDS